MRTSRVLVHHRGAYNFYSNIADCPTYESALTLGQVIQVVKMEEGERGLRELPKHLERARKYGTSSYLVDSLTDFLSVNRAGPSESCLPFEAFIEKYLTLPSDGPTFTIVSVPLTVFKIIIKDTRRTYLTEPPVPLKRHRSFYPKHGFDSTRKLEKD